MKTSENIAASCHSISVSAMKDWLKCPQYAWNLHVAHRGPEKRPVPLDVGTLFHEAMAAHLDGAVHIPGTELPSWYEVSEEAREKYIRHKLWLPVNTWVPDPDWKVLGEEVKLEAPVGIHTLQGTIDAPIEWNGKLWSGQWKTYDGGSEPEAALLQLLEKVRLSYYEVAYQWLMEQTICKQYRLPYGGVILGACEKLPSYKIINHRRVDVTDDDRAGALTFHYLKRSQEQQAELWGHTLYALMGAARELDDDPEQWHNLDFCFGPYGRTLCPFFSVCHEGGSLDDPKFVDLKTRY